MLRQPAVAGQFYTDNPTELRQQVEAMLATTIEPQPACGVMMPHAGYVYSGAIAGEALARVTVPDTVLLLGPNHHGVGAPCALFQSGQWQTPLGTVDIDDVLAQQLLDEVPLLVADSAAHRYEHSLEVEVPFLQVKNPQVKIVPLMLGTLSLPTLQSLAAGISTVLGRLERKVLVVASSDMTHYEPATVVKAKDQLALDPLLNLDGVALYQQVKKHQISMCGVCAATLMVMITKALGAKYAELVRYGHSGEVSGDNDAVVGYAGVVIR